MTLQRRQRCPWAEGGDDAYLAYHDQEWGVPVHDDRVQFEFLTLESAQAGLSWEIILRKREGYRAAFRGFDPAAVARFNERSAARLMQDPGIVRNRLKIDAAIENARRIVALRESDGGFARWLDAHHVMRAGLPLPSRDDCMQ